MKKVLSLLFILVSLVGFSQDDSSYYTKYPNVYGIQYPRIWATKVLKAPSDTTYSKNGLVIKAGVLYVGNGTKWSAVTGGGSSIDTTSLSNRINARLPLSFTSTQHINGNHFDLYLDSIDNIIASNADNINLYGATSSGLRSGGLTLIEGSDVDITGNLNIVSGAGVGFWNPNTSVYNKILNQGNLWTIDFADNTKSLTLDGTNSGGNTMTLPASDGTPIYRINNVGCDIAGDMVIDSSVITDIHSEAYYNTKYAPISVNGTVTSVSRTNGLGISASVANSTTTPNITIAVDTSNSSIISRQRAAGTYQTILTNPITGTGTTNEIAYFNGASTLGSLTTATYPSLTELSYVKGVTSAIQTQINAKGSGTVTSVATGYGLSGGTITSIGTLLADSSVLVTKASNQTITGVKTINPTVSGSDASVLNLNGTVTATANSQVLYGLKAGTTFSNGSNYTTNYRALYIQNNQTELIYTNRNSVGAYSGAATDTASLIMNRTTSTSPMNFLFSFTGTTYGGIRANYSTGEIRFGGFTTGGYYSTLYANNGEILRATALSGTTTATVGIGVTAPTAALHLKAGTATASTAPLKFNSGTNLTTIENGAVEYDGTNYYVSAGGTRQTVAMGKSGSYSGVGTATTTFTVTFGGTQPNSTYKVNVTPTASLSAALFYVTNKTTTTFDVMYLSGLTGTVTFDWLLTQ